MSSQVLKKQKVIDTIQEQSWPPQGRWTYEDYLRLPDDGWRYEVIQGELYW